MMMSNYDAPMVRQAGATLTSVAELQWPLESYKKC
jgi:hypothetical protein